MIFFSRFITIVFYIFIQQSTQVPILRNNVKALPPFVLRQHRRMDIAKESQTQLQNVTLNRQKLQKATENKKKLSDGTVTVNGYPVHCVPFEENIEKKKRPIRDFSDGPENINMRKYEDDMKNNDNDRKPEYDAYGKRYYRVAVEDDGNGVRYDMYEDDAGTRYYKVYVIDDRAGFVVINGVRYYPTSRPGNKQSQKMKVPLNQLIYCKTIQNFDQHNVFNHPTPRPENQLVDKIKNSLKEKLENKLFSKLSYFVPNAAKKTREFNLRL